MLLSSPVQEQHFSELRPKKHSIYLIKDLNAPKTPLASETYLCGTKETPKVKWYTRALSTTIPLPNTITQQQKKNLSSHQGSAPGIAYTPGIHPPDSVLESSPELHLSPLCSKLSVTHFQFEIEKLFLRNLLRIVSHPSSIVSREVGNLPTA